MKFPFNYAQGDGQSFGGTDGPRSTFAEAAAVILPVPLERTVSYVPGTRLGPCEILKASTQLELWDEELAIDVHARGVCTLPEMELPESRKRAKTICFPCVFAISASPKGVHFWDSLFWKSSIF